MSTAKSITQAFETYRQARTLFAQQVADAATRPSNTDILMRCGVMVHLTPLLDDPSYRVQQYAVLAIGRLVNASEIAAQECLKLNMVQQLMKGLDERTKYYKKSAMCVVRGIAKRSSEMTKAILCQGALEGILTCMEDFDPIVKESAITALDNVVKHSIVYAESAVTSGAIPLLKLALQEPEVCLRQMAASSLSGIAKHDVTLAQAIIDSGCIPCLANCISSPSPKLKQSVFCCLSNISKHTEEMAEVVLEADIMSEVLLNLGSEYDGVKKSAASLICEIIKHHVQFSKLVVNSGGLGGLLTMIRTSKESTIFPGILAIGFISAESDQLASAAINSRAIEVLSYVLESKEITAPHVKAAAAWATGQIGKHSAEHAALVASSNLLLILLNVYLNAYQCEDLKQKSLGALKLVIRKCKLIEYLEPLLHIAPPEILKYVIGQFAQTVPISSTARRLLVTSGSLKKIQELEAPPGTTLHEYINIVNSCFPEEIINYYSPGYPESLLKNIEEFIPETPIKMAADFEDPEDADLVAELNIPPRSEFDVC